MDKHSQPPSARPDVERLWQPFAADAVFLPFAFFIKNATAVSVAVGKGRTKESFSYTAFAVCIVLYIYTAS